MQGNLDPLRLVAGGKALTDGVDAILRALGDGPLIFNLGHGITPERPVKHVEEMIAQVRKACSAMSERNGTSGGRLAGDGRRGDCARRLRGRRRC